MICPPVYNDHVNTGTLIAAILNRINMTDEPLLSGLEFGFIDRERSAEERYIPQFLVNDPSKNEKVITTIKHELSNCDEFMFSVAFVTYGGVNILLNELKSLQERNIKGKIMVSQYQNFTQPAALKKLSSFPNIDLRIVTEEQMKMHSKCYIFRKGDSYDVVIGSSNLTNDALCTNGEWNLKFNSKDSGDVISNIINEFEKVFNHSTKIDDVWIEGYALIYDDAKVVREAVRERSPERLANFETKRIVPNKMQAEALQNLDELRNNGENRALVVSATGSGKTYLSAFDAKVYDKKYLYIVHRRPILNKSIDSFRKVIGHNASIGKYDPEKNNLNLQYLFTTIQTISKDYVLKNIPPETFDYIVIDEVHHAGASTYQKVINYFRPKFLMGMTATPDRTDGYDIYSLFNHNIAYDIRLKQAMELNLICPFHYFGISDIDIDGKSYDDKTVFSEIEDGQRVNHVIRNAEFYGHSGKRVKGIVFCSRISAAQRYSRMFNERGYRTTWVSGELDKDLVENDIERLEADEGDVLDYIFTADLFNEGVDIPSVNQIIMLRPTQSPIVYIQQLGRGLRLHKDKEFVVILDFIGNYEKNYNIPLALSDDHTYNKAETRRFVETGDSIIPGNSTISFDEISKKRIYESIDNPSFGNKKTIFEEYKNLKMKLGRIPDITDFKTYGSIEPTIVISEYKSYHNFLKAKEKEYSVSFSKEKEKVLEFLSRLIVPGKRIYEIDILERINLYQNDILSFIHNNYDSKNPHLSKALISIFDGSFYSDSPVFIRNGRISEEYISMLNDEEFVKQVQDIISIGKLNNSELYSETYDDTDFVLYKQYNYDDVCRLLNWKKSIVALNIGGYKYDEGTNTFPVFINYVKSEDIQDSIKYEDRFENRNTLIGVSKSSESVNSRNMVRVRDSEKNGMTIHLFVRKNKDDPGALEFYYLGKMRFEEFVSNATPCEIRYRLDKEVRSDLYDYIV